MKKTFFLGLLWAFGTLFAQEPVQWRKAGRQAFPVYDSLWSRARSVGGIGQIRSIAVDEENPSHLVVGSYGGGIWETYRALEANPVQWSPLTENIPAYAIGRVMLYKGDIYACTSSNILAKYTSSVHERYGLGVIVKRKGESEWRISPGRLPFVHFDMTEQNGRRILYAVTLKKIYKSTDDAYSWQELKSFAKHHIKGDLQAVIVDPEDPQRVMVSSMGKEKILFLTTDGGQTWKDISSVFEQYFTVKKAKVRKYTVEMRYDRSTATLYLALRISGSVYILKTKDWVHFSPYNATGKALHMSAMLDTDFLPLENNDILFGGTLLHRLIDGKKVRSLSIHKIHDDIRSLQMAVTALGDTILYVGHDGGISISRDMGETFENNTGNLLLFQAFGMAYSRSTEHRYITVGVQDGTWYRLDRDGDDHWHLLSMCCEGSVYSRPGDTETLFFNNNGRMMKNVSGLTPPPGKTIKTKSIVKVADLDAPLAFHPEDKNTLVFNKYFWPGKGNPYGNILLMSYDYGNTTRMVKRIEGDTPYMWGRPTAMQYSPSDSGVFYMSTVYYDPETAPDFQLQVHLYKSVNMNDDPDEIRFEDITSRLEKAAHDILDKGPVNDICVDPSDAGRLWMCFGNLEDGKKVYRSDDGGMTWKNITYDLENYPANKLLYDEANHRLYLGTDTGVYILRDKHWERYGKAMPYAIISDMDLDTQSGELIAATYGKGVWIAPVEKACDDWELTGRTVLRSSKEVCGDLIMGEHSKLILKNKAVLRVKCVRNPMGRKIKIRNGKLITSCDK